MDRFEYLAALVSVVAGLGMARALSGYARLFQSEDHTRISAPHVAWTFSIVLWLVGFWWFTFMLSSIQEWTITLLLFVLGYGATIYFQIALLFPEDFGKRDDIFGSFVDRRRSFFAVFLLLGVIDVTDTIVKAEVYGMSGPPILPYIMLMTAWFILGFAGIWVTSRLAHQVMAYFWLAVILTWSITTLTV